MSASDYRQFITDEALVSLAADLIRFPSWKGEEDDLARWLADYFNQREYEVDLQEVEPGRHQVLARLHGSGSGSSLMFNGHLDIDPIRAGWQRDPFTPVAQEGLVYGAGIRNMKAGVASMIVAAEALRLSRTELKGDLVLACVVGELQGGVGTVHALEQGLRTDAAIVPEPFGADNLVLTTSGVLELALTTSGFSEHVSRSESAVSALDPMMQIVSELQSMTFSCDPDPRLPGLPRLVVGGIIGGRSDNYDLRSPAHTIDYCTITIDVRFLPGQTAQSVEADIVSAIEGLRSRMPHLNYRISHEPRTPFDLHRISFPPATVPASERVVELLSECYHEVVGAPPQKVGVVHPYSYTGADTAHLWNAGIPSVLFGPEGPTRVEGAVDDCVYLAEMRRVSEVMAATAQRFCNQVPGVSGREGEAIHKRLGESEPA